MVGIKSSRPRFGGPAGMSPSLGRGIAGIFCRQANDGADAVNMASGQSRRQFESKSELIQLNENDNVLLQVTLTRLIHPRTGDVDPASASIDPVMSISAVSGFSSDAVTDILLNQRPLGSARRRHPRQVASSGDRVHGRPSFRRVHSGSGIPL
jgi:hypothetical protein